MTTTAQQTMSPSQVARLAKGARAAAWQGSRWIHPAERQAIYIRDGRKCLFCGSRESASNKMSLDHVVAHELGGTDAATNLITACCRCNFRKQAKSVREFVKVLAAEGVNVKAIPARIRRQTVKATDRAAGQVAVRAIARAKRAAK